MLVSRQIKRAERHYYIYHDGLKLGHITTFNVLYKMNKQHLTLCLRIFLLHLHEDDSYSVSHPFI